MMNDIFLHIWDGLQQAEGVKSYGVGVGFTINMRRKGEVHLRGKKYSDEIKEKAYALYAVNGSYAETGKALNIPANTVCSWIKNKPPDKFDELRDEKKRDFIERAGEIIDIALDRLKEELLSADELQINHLTTVIGTLYDKRALAKGESTGNTKITFDLPPEIEDYAG